MMQYYLFASFIFALVCLTFIVWRLIFSRFKKDIKNINQKKDEINALLAAIRKEADDFYDMASDKADVIIEERKRISALTSGFAFAMRSKKSSESSLQSIATTPPLSITDDVKPTLIYDFQKAIESAVKKQNDLYVANNKDGKSDESRTSNAAIATKSFGIGTKTHSNELNKASRGAALTRETAKTKREKITVMLDEGKSYIQIAKELGVTRNEVDLVVKTRFDKYVEYASH